MPTPAMLLSRLGFVMSAKETTQGTGVAGTVTWPLQTIKPTDDPQYVDDDSIANSQGKIRGVYQAEKDAAFEMGGLLFPDTVGHLFVMGGMFDSTTATAGSKTGTVAALAVGATTATYTLGAGSAPIIGDVFQFDTGANGIAECRTLSNVSGAGPYTLTWVAPLLYAHAGGAAANNVTGNETHTFKLSNNTGTNQPPSYSFTHFNNVSSRQYPGAVLDSFDLSINARGAVKHSSKFKAWPSSTVTKPTPAYATTASYLGWEGSVTVGGSSNAKLISGTISLKRTTESTHTASGTQNPYVVFADAIEGAMKLKFYFLDEVDWTHINSNDQPAVVVTLTPPNAGPILTITSTVTAWKKAPVDSTNKMMQVGDIDITCVTNSTDGGPFAATLVNAVVPGY